VGTSPQVVSVLFYPSLDQVIDIFIEVTLKRNHCDEIFLITFLMSHRVQNNMTSQGIFELAVETNLNFTGNALYGYDTVALSYLGSSVPSLDQPVVADIATQEFYMG
jgi:hypothetical protein